MCLPVCLRHCHVYTVQKHPVVIVSVVVSFVLVLTCGFIYEYVLPAFPGPRSLCVSYFSYLYCVYFPSRRPPASPPRFLLSYTRGMRRGAVRGGGGGGWLGWVPFSVNGVTTEYGVTFCDFSFCPLLGADTGKFCRFFQWFHWVGKVTFG